MTVFELDNYWRLRRLQRQHWTVLARWRVVLPW